MRLYQFTFWSFILLTSCTSSNSTENEVRNVILLIGDGMGTNQVFAGMLGKQDPLEMERAQYVGLSKTASANFTITDSGAGGTAISTGKKTKNRTIGIDVYGQAQPTILELAEDKGLATGMVATSSITHATPASFIAHHQSRYATYEIAEQFVGSGIDIFIGGGRKFFEEKTNVSNKLRSEGYTIVYDVNDINPSSTKPIGCLADSIDMPKMLEGRGDYLADATNKALLKLSQNSSGFFLMIEGSQIDWACHDKDIEYLTAEVLDFDKVVGLAFDYADSNPGTLVIVTADHATGSLSFVGSEYDSNPVVAHFASKYHSPDMVPVLTYGAQAEQFAGIYENTKLFELIVNALKLYEK